jgi:hypothetical protein
MTDLTKAIPSNPWVKEETRYSRPEYILDVPAFAAALAAQLGGTVEATESGFAGSARIRVGELCLYVRTEHGAKFGRVEIHSGAPEATDKLHYSERPSFPSGSFDTARPLDRLAADIRRRIIEPAAEPTAKAKAKLEANNGHRAQLEAAAAELRAAFPTVQITIRDGTSVTQADVYYSRDGAHLSGRLNADGSLNVERIWGADTVQLFKALGL